MEGIGFKNMKVFKKNQWFDFKDITLLTGTNNSGKSSIINAMQMMQENINAINIDELIKTEFRLAANHNKYGSIESFINNQPKEQNDSFEFVRRFGSLEYRVEVNVKTGLESSGSVKTITVTDYKKNADVFHLAVENPYPDYQCVFRINFKYFTDKFYKKCINTSKLFRKRIELDNLEKRVNSGKATLNELEALGKSIQEEVSVYVHVFESELVDVIGSDEKEFYPVDKNKIEANYIISKKRQIEFFSTDLDELDEVLVFFDDKKDTLVSEELFNSSYVPALKSGIFDFSTLWEMNPEARGEIEKLLCSYYKAGAGKSYRLLCDDLITILSHTSWKMKANSRDVIDASFLGRDITKSFICSLPDFGLVATRVAYKTEEGNQVKKNAVADHFIDAFASLDREVPIIKRLERKGYFSIINQSFSKVLFDSFRNEDPNFSNRKQIIPDHVFKEISSDIRRSLLDLNLGFSNVYVSSNRFIAKRSYSFNDNSDFTNLLKQVEKVKSSGFDSCKRFIDKWLKEFDIAHELVLRPDSDTGNFKAYLRINKAETPLADFGLGTNQVLPIIFSLGVHFYSKTMYSEELLPRTVVIEEPEANLHPALQSKLADMFVDANRTFKVQIIAETHSEYLIRKLQFLTAKNEINSCKTVIYYFHKPDQIPVGGEQVKRIEIQKDGSLSDDFGPGFFDEADNLAVQLYLSKRKPVN